MDNQEKALRLKIDDNLSDAIIIFNSKTGNIKYTNSCAKKLSSNATNISSVFNSSYDLLLAVKNKLQKSDKVELKYRKDGRYIKSIFSQYSDTLMFCVCTDTTDVELQNKNAVRVSKIESMELMASGIAHDFNSILSGIVLNTELLLLYENNDWAKAKRSIKLIKNMVENAKGIVSRLRSISKGIDPKFETVLDFSNLIKDIVEFSSKGCPVSIKFNSHFKGLKANVDKALITQLINNLIVNSIDAVKKSSIKIITVTISEFMHKTEFLHYGLTPDSTYIKISVSDTGMGIPEEIRRR